METKTLYLDGVETIVTEDNIISVFQDVCKNHLCKTEDAGCGMRNLFVRDIVIQTYPNDEYHNVWILFYDYADDTNYEYELTEYSFDEQLNYLKEYCEQLGINISNN